VGAFAQIPGALQALRFSLDVHGEGAVEIVPAYLLLAEANLGMPWLATLAPLARSGVSCRCLRRFGPLSTGGGVSVHGQLECPQKP